MSYFPGFHINKTVSSQLNKLVTAFSLVDWVSPVYNTSFTVFFIRHCQLIFTFIFTVKETGEIMFSLALHHYMSKYKNEIKQNIFEGGIDSTVVAFLYCCFIYIILLYNLILPRQKSYNSGMLFDSNFTHTHTSISCFQFSMCNNFI